MDTKNLPLRVGIGIGLGVVAYFLFKYVSKKFYKVKPNDMKSFVNADGKESSYHAQRYDATHQNQDGSLGATWIAYNTNPLIGYWEKGKIEIGKPMFP
jgi:hypothetical protein